MDKYKNDPTNDFETVKEYTPEEVYYHTEGLEVPEIAEQYIVYLERKIKAKNDALKELHELLQVNDKMAYYTNKIWKLFKL